VPHRRLLVLPQNTFRVTKVIFLVSLIMDEDGDDEDHGVRMVEFRERTDSVLR